jgi:hypothetical protein
MNKVEVVVEDVVEVLKIEANQKMAEAQWDLVVLAEKIKGVLGKKLHTNVVNNYTIRNYSYYYS